MSTLLFPRSKVEEDIKHRIKLGKEILLRTITNESELKQANTDEDKWNEHNCRLLKHCVDDDTLFKEYNSGMDFATSHDSFNTKVKRLHSSLEDGIDKLESILEQLTFIPESPDHIQVSGDHIEAHIGDNASNVNVGKGISSVNIGDIEGGIHGSNIAGRDIHFHGDIVHGEKKINHNSVTSKSGYPEESELGHFGDISSNAKLLIQDKPSYWELLLTLELIRPKIQKIQLQLTDLDKGLLYRESKLVSNQDFLVWFQKKVHDLQAIPELFCVVVNERLMDSWGKSGEPGNAQKIKGVSDVILTGCNALLEWEIDVYYTYAGAFEPIREKMKGWTRDWIRVINCLLDEIAELVERPNPEGQFRIDLSFEPPKGIENIVKDIEEIYSRNVF